MLDDFCKNHLHKNEAMNKVEDSVNDAEVGNDVVIV